MSKNKRRKTINQNRLSQTIDDYDLKSSLSKLNQRRVFDGGSTNPDIESNDYNKNINSSSLVSHSNENTGFFLQINDSINSRYDKLKDDISCVSDKIGESTSELREEFDNKLDKKVSEKLFYGAISVIVVMATLIYLLSYSDLLKDNKKIKTDVINIKTKINGIDTKSESNNKQIDLISKELEKKTKHNTQ